MKHPSMHRSMLADLYDERPCWICGRLGWCGDREPLVDMAELDYFSSLLFTYPPPLVAVAETRLPI
jgi:hypothetical protein